MTLLRKLCFYFWYVQVPTDIKAECHQTQCRRRFKRRSTFTSGRGRRRRWRRCRCYTHSPQQQQQQQQHRSQQQHHQQQQQQRRRREIWKKIGAKNVLALQFFSAKFRNFIFQVFFAFGSPFFTTIYVSLPYTFFAVQLGTAVGRGSQDVYQSIREGKRQKSAVITL